MEHAEENEQYDTEVPNDVNHVIHWSMSRMSLLLHTLKALVFIVSVPDLASTLNKMGIHEAQHL